MTVVIAAITQPDGYIVAVSDTMLSYGDQFKATEQGARKELPVCDGWRVAFAGDPMVYKAVVLKIMRAVKNIALGDRDAATMKRLASEAYSEVQQEEFTALNLYQMGYRSIDEFMQSGQAKLGDLYQTYLRELREFKLEIDLLVFGHDNRSNPHLFGVVNPGKVIDHSVLGFAAVGSGYTMAMAWLTLKEMARNLETVIYRLLEAKFSSETAAGVGTTTVIVTMNSNGEVGSISLEEINNIRAIWGEALKEPIPEKALNIISKSRAVTTISNGER